MINKLLDFVVGREPVAAATGLAAVVTAAAGVLTAFNVVTLTAEQIAALGALAAAVAGWAGRSAVTPVHVPKAPPEHGGIPLAMIIGLLVIFVIIGGLFATCDALWTDEDEPGDLNMGALPALVADHDCWEGDCYGGGDRDYGSDYSSDDRNRNRGRNRGAFSPGPFDDSPVDAFNNNTICLPGSTCYTDDRQRDERRQQPQSVGCLIPVPFHCDPKPEVLL